MLKSFARRVSLVVVSLVVGSPGAMAGAPKQNHHCKLADGSIDTTKTHKQCTAAKGEWAKDAADAAPAASATPAAPATK